MKEELISIIDHYGINAQQRQLNEEIFELQEAIIQYEEPRRYRSKEHIIEELADVEVMLRQIQLYYQIEDKDITNIMTKKVIRQIERIKNELEVI